MHTLSCRVANVVPSDFRCTGCAGEKLEGIYNTHEIVTSLLPHCTGQRKSQDQPKLECAGTTKLSGKGYIEAINVIESIGAFDLTQDKRATFY